MDRVVLFTFFFSWFLTQQNCCILLAVFRPKMAYCFLEFYSHSKPIKQRHLSTVKSRFFCDLLRPIQAACPSRSTKLQITAAVVCQCTNRTCQAKMKACFCLFHPLCFYLFCFCTLTSNVHIYICISIIIIFGNHLFLFFYPRYKLAVCIPYTHNLCF